MGKNKHWALIANRYDHSMLRNRLVSYMSEGLGFEFTPKMLPVDLVINGKYAGSYYLSETVRIDKNRLDIDELKAEDNSEPEITGSYLMGLDPFFFKKEFDYRNTYYLEGGMCVWFEDPDFYNLDGDEVGTQEQYDYIRNYLTFADEAIMSDDFKDMFGNPYTDYLDTRSSADFWWVQEFVMNEDGFRSASNYFYKKRNDKIYWGPLWDFDYSMGLYLKSTEGFNYTHNPWLDRLRAYDPEYQQLLRERWTVLDRLITEILTPGGKLDQYAEELKKSAEDDFRRWGSNSQFLRERYDFDTETALVRTWLADRQAWINQHIDTELTEVFARVTFMVGGETIYIEKMSKGGLLGYKPDDPEEPHKIFKCWIDQYGKEYDYGTIVNYDVVLTPYYYGDPEPVPQPSQQSEVSEDPQPSQQSEVSEDPQPSQQSEVSEEPLPSQQSEVSEEPQPSQQSEISEEPQPSQQSEVSHSSGVISKAPENSKPSSPTPSGEAPKTGDVFPVAAMLITTLASLAAAVLLCKKKKN